MKFHYLALASSIALLAACGDNSSETTQQDVRPADVINAPTIARIQYSPADGLVPVPNDLLFSGTMDGTLEMPAETAAKANGEAVNLADPSAVLGALDGWSTQMPLRIPIDLPEGVSFDTSTISPTSVYMVEALMGGATGCEQVPRGAACAPVAALTYGVDYFVTSTGADLVVVPLRPLKPATTYLVGVSHDISDSNGNAIGPAPLYEQVARDDITINEPETLGPLQGAINSYEGVISAQIGRPQSDLIYSSAWTTQSVGVDLSATIAIAQQSQVQVGPITNQGITVEQAFIAQGALPAEVAGLTPLAEAQLHRAEITLPYYLATPSAEDPTAPLTSAWTAMCDSGAILAAADLSDPALEAGDNHAACTGFGLADFGLDTERYITQFNPVPLVRSLQTIPVQITTPVSAAGPYPVVILQHGITSRKEDMLAVTGAFSQAGFATIAIDHPIHGERGFDVSGNGEDDFNASDISALHYMNLTNLLVGRDNTKQSIADMLALRVAIATDLGGTLTGAGIDVSQVHFSGLSLGGITGVGFVSLANQNGLTIQAASFSAPGGAVGPLLIESQSFGNLVQGSVVLGAGTELSGQLAAFMQSPVEGCEGITDPTTLLGCAYPAFVASVSDNPAAIAEIQTNVASFALASQTVLDSSDPNNFAAGIVSTATPAYVAEVIGDTVIPNQTTNYPVGGTDPLAMYMGLTQVDANTAGATSGLVKFTAGSHGSYLSPAASEAVTTEMQTQAATFHAAGILLVTDGSVVQNAPTQM